MTKQTDLVRKAVGDPADWSYDGLMSWFDLIESMRESVDEDVIVESIKRAIDIVKIDFEL